MAFNLLGAITGAVAGYFLGPEAGYGLYLAIAGGALVGGFYADLVPVPEPPKGMEQGSQTYDARLKNNRALRGSVRPIGFGQWTAWYAELMSYTEFHDNEQHHYGYYHVTIAEADEIAERIGTTPVSNFPGQRVQWMGPGDALTLFHPNVYTSPDVENIELIGGLLATVAFSDEYVFASSTRIETPCHNTPISEYDYYDLSLYEIPIGTVITVSGHPSNDGDYTVTNTGQFVACGGEVGSYIEVTGAALVVGSGDSCTISYDNDVDNAKTTKIVNVPLTFTTSPNKIVSTADSLSQLSVGDLWGVQGSVSNDGVEFEIVGTNSSDEVYVIPNPTPEVLMSGTLVLLRRKVGPVYAAPVGERANSIGLDFVFGQGLFSSGETGNINSRFVYVLAEYRSVDDAGNALSGWNQRVFVMYGDDTKPRRFSQLIVLTEAIRPQVRVWRATVEVDDYRVRDAITWAGLRGYLAPRGDEHPDVDLLTTRVAIQARSSGLLSRVQQKSINGDQLRRLPFWDAGTQSWTETQPTRSAYWAALWWALTQTRGRVVEGDINLDQFAERAADADARGITFDANFDVEGLSWEAAQSILGVDRARTYKDARTGLISVYRDEVTAPALMLVECPNGNCAIGDVATATPTSDTPTGVRAKFIQPVTWQERDDAPLAGADTKVREFSFFGCTDWYQSWAQAMYQLWHIRYRTQTTTADTEMAGLLAQFGDRVLIACARLGWGQGGQVTAYSGSTLQVWPEPLWTEGAQHYVYLQSPVGAPGARIDCERGTRSGELILASAPDVTLRVGQGLRTLYAMGHDGTTGDPLLDMEGEPILDMEGDPIYDEPSAVPASHPRIWIVESGQPNGRHRCTLSLRNEDERVHADPGDAPADPLATVGAAPALVITGLAATVSATDIAVTADITPAAVYYEGEWRYAGQSGWSNFMFGTEPAGSIRAVVNGVVSIRMMAHGDSQMGAWAYTSIVVTDGVEEALAVTVSPGALSTASTSAPVTSLPGSCTATGGRPPYTYSWTQDSGDYIEIIDPAAYQTIYSSPAPGPGETRTGIFRCTVTDADGTTGYDTQTVTLTRI